MKRFLKDEIVLSESSKTVKVLVNPSFKMIGLGFKKGQALEKHTTSTKSYFNSPDWEVEFLMDGVKHNLQAGVFFEIPENVEHEVHALADSYLYLIK